MNKFNQSKQKEISRSNINGKTMRLISGVALAATILGMGSEIASAGEVHTQSSASAIAKELNTAQRVAKNVVVELGYTIPVNNLKSMPGATEILNPIKLSKDTYGYFVFSGSPHQPGYIKLHTLKYDKPLQKTEFAGMSKEFNQEIVTSIAYVYQSVDSPNGVTTLPYITIGNKTGWVNDLVNVSTGFSSNGYSADIQNAQYYQMPIVGEPTVG